LILKGTKTPQDGPLRPVPPDPAAFWTPAEVVQDQPRRDGKDSFWKRVCRKNHKVWQFRHSEAKNEALKILGLTKSETK